MVGPWVCGLRGNWRPGGHLVDEALLASLDTENAVLRLEDPAYVANRGEEAPLIYFFNGKGFCKACGEHFAASLPPA